MAPLSKALSISGLCKDYGGLRGVKNISFEVGCGEIVGLLGPNGAGKTTIINMILGVLKQTTGNIQIMGIDISKKRSRALELTNFAAVYAPLPGNLTVYQNLMFFGLLYGVKRINKRIEELLEEFELTELRDRKCGALSSGEQTRAGLAKALMNLPRVLLLDEPTASIDPATAKIIRAKIKSLSSKHNIGVLWTSHNMYEVEEVCDRVMFLTKGEILIQGNPRRLPSQYGMNDLEELFIGLAKDPAKLSSLQNKEP